MVDAGFMSNQSNSKDMKMLQAGIDSMKVQNDSIGRTYYKEAMASTYKATSNTLSKADTIKIDLRLWVATMWTVCLMWLL